MEYQEALRKLNTATQHNLFVISGEENYLAQRYLNSLLHHLNPDKDPDMLQTLDGNSDLQQLYQALDSSPFFSSQNIIYMEEPKFLTSSLTPEQEKTLFSYLSDIPSYNILILRTNNKLDKRKKLSKHLAKYGVIVECEAIPPWKIEPWLKEHLRELNLDFDHKALMYMLELIRAMETISLEFIHQELTKLKLIVGNELVTTKILKDNLASLPEVSSFRLWEALCEHRLSTALNLYAIQIEAGIHPLKLLGLLVRQCRQLWQVKIFIQQGQNKKDISQKLNLSEYITEKIMKQAAGFSLKTIEETMENLCEADLKLKTGQQEPAMMERIFIEFLQ